MNEKIEVVLNEQIRPYLQSHNGNVRLAGYMDGVVQIELQGSCAGCASADLDTRLMIEDVLKKAIPEITGVELVRNVDADLLAFARKILSGELVQG